MPGAIDFITGNKFPGAFIVDAAMALIPASEAHSFGWPFWAQLVLYWLTVIVLRGVDGQVVRSGWRIWWRGIIKIPIIVVAEFVGSLGAIESCGASGVVCHRLIF
ncbi:MAG TPA: hypothetical protein VKI44_37455 [Acetobacteraceae bacterium]|nr:hypothetical protein [Acetobacteraceae bacterium]